MKTPYMEGFKAHRKGVDWSECPYAQDYESNAWEKWQHGWQMADTIKLVSKSEK
jgi:ribosome modulation factor